MALPRQHNSASVRGFLYGLLLLVSPVVVSLGFSPPWPHSAAAITAGCLGLYLLFVFQFRVSVPGQRAGQFITIILVVGACLSLAGYLLLFERFTFELPTTGERIVVGCGFTDEGRLVAQSLLMNTQGECPGHFEDLLEKSQYDAHQIWKKSSLELVRLSLAGLWAGFFACLGALVGKRIRVLQVRGVESPELAGVSTGDVFISYSHEDRDRAQLLVTAFKKDGLSVWWDADLPPGGAWDRLLEQRLQTAHSVVVLWSKVSVTKAWVREEALDAHQRNVLIPVLLDDVPPPLGFRHVQALSMVGWTSDAADARYQQLVSTLKQRRTQGNS
ncbi:MAG TPA: toll/interleukin-1 receptor domain-containing protein [Candidatus Acidoferrum sp.]|nr:toll/interleukin-1 receptor domain-containing protein [Candidatus Acidoferrum sp.]